MPLTQDTLDALKRLVAKDEVLTQRLSEVEDAAGAARLLAEAALKHGLAVDTAQIEAYFIEQIGQHPSEISDESLEAVAGGMRQMTVAGGTALSIFTFMFGCLAYSHQHNDPTQSGCLHK